MTKKLYFGEEAQQKIFKGCEVVYKAVTTTLGPKGLNVPLDKPYGAPLVVHDGVTVAKDIELKDETENMGAQLLIEAAIKTNDKAGDGTTTAILLSYRIIKEGLKQIANGENPQIFKEEMKEAMGKVIKYLEGITKKIKSNEEIAHIATIAAVNDEVGKMVAEAYDKVGKDGVVTADVGTMPFTEVEYKEGLVIPHGFQVPHFATDPQTLTCELDNPYILVTDEDITAVPDLTPILEAVYKKNKTIMIVAKSFGGAVIPTLIQNKYAGTLKPLAVRGPNVEGAIDDVAIAVGGTLFGENASKRLSSDDITLDDLGRADKVICDQNETIIIGGKGKKKAIKDRAKLLRNLIADPETEFLEEKYRERLSKFCGGIAVIYAGGASEQERKEKRLRIEDAVNAAKAAIDEGVIPGGGMSLYHSRQVLDEKGSVGERILYNVLSSQLEKLLENAGKPQHEVLHKIKGNDPSFVYNVLTDQFGDAYKMGVIDPLLVVRLALENAVSVAGMILTTGCTIGIVKDEDTEYFEGTKVPKPKK